MSFRTFFLAFLSLTAVCSAKDFEPFAGPQPMAVLLQEKPWAPIMGAETPRIVIYSNGDIIYSRGSGDDQVYFYAEMSYPVLARVTDHLTPLTNVTNLKPRYSVTGATDQGAALFYLHVNGKEVVTSVYGLRPEDDNGGPKARSLSKLPPELRELYHYLLTVDFSESRPWHSAYAEAMIFPVEDTSGGVLHWPKAWPDLKSDRVIKRKEGYSIFLDGSMHDELKSFLSNEKKDGAVEIDGRNWSVASRSVFPSEPVWRKAFSSLEDN